MPPAGDKAVQRDETPALPGRSRPSLTISSAQGQQGFKPLQATIRYSIVQRSDTIYKLAQRYGTTLEAIIELNPGIDPYNLQNGQVIKIPKS